MITLSHHRFNIALASTLLLLTLVGCGQTGPLRLPESSPSPSPEVTTD